MRNFTKLKWVITVFLMTFYQMSDVGAQNNIAPQATVSASTCNTGPCSTLNDLNLGTCGSQSMWISTSSPPSTTPGVNWIQWDFPSAVSVDQFVIHHANGPVTSGRNMDGFLIQTWNGSTWVNHQTISGLPRACINTVPFTPIQGVSRFRITSFTMFPQGQLSNPNFREIEVIEAILVNDNAATLAIDSPSVFCEGFANIKATIGNRGLNQINSVIVNWKIGPTLQTPIAFVGLLDTANGSGPRDTTLYLGSQLFGAGIPEQITVWTSMPNGVADQNTGDDTLSETKQPSLSGNFTINPLGSGTFNYLSIADAVNDLNTFGICGAVHFDVTGGTYTEQMTLGEVEGASATNTITFAGDTATPVIVEYGATSSADNWVLKMEKTSWVTIDGFTFQNANSGSTAYRAVVSFNGGSSNNTFMNNTFNFYGGSTSSSTNYTGWYTNSAGNNNNMFLNNSFKDGNYYGFYFRGSGNAAASTNAGNVFDGNSFATGYYYGIYFYYTMDHTFINNTFEPASNASNTGYSYYSYYNYGSLNFSGNYIDARYYGPRIAYNYGKANNRGLISNNMIHTGMGTSTVYGAYIYYNQFTDFVHNTVWADGGPSSSVYGVYLYYGNDNLAYNNVIYRPQGSTGTYGIYLPSAAAYTDVDYNNIWAPTGNVGVNGPNDQHTNPGYTKKDSMYTCNDTLDGAGIAFPAVMYDFQGDNRNATTPDIGADEFLGGDSSIFSAGPDGLLCNGNMIEIGTSVSGAQYIWNTLDTTGKIMVNAIGDYTVSVTSACGGAFLDVVNVSDNTPNAVFNYTNSYYTGLFKDGSRPNVDAWRWVMYNSPSGKTNPMDTIWAKDQNYLFPDNGPYYVCLTTYNECDTIETCNVWTGTVGMNESNLNDAISLIPNPVSSTLYIQFSNFNSKQINVEMTNVQGQVVYNNQFTNVSPNDSKSIDVSVLNKGMYIVKFTSENEVIAKQIIVQ